MLFKNSATLAAALSVISSVEGMPQALNERAARCNGDNLLNRFRNAKYSAAAISFCQTYIHSVTYSVVTVSTDAAHVSSPVTTYSTVYPTPLITTVYPETRLSSACSCISVSQVTAVVTEYVASTTAAVTTSTDDPVTTTTDDPVTTTTDDPVTTTTDDPATTTTDDPVTTTTDDPVTTTTDNPVTTTTDDPVTTTTDDPATTTTDDPSTTTDDPSTTTTTDDPSTTTTTSESTPSATGPVALGCYSEGTTGRTLAVAHNSAEEQVDMTVEKCATLCSGYEYYGVEYAGECYCGDAILNGAFKLADQSVCNLACKGDSSEFCGGLSALNIYGPAQDPAPLPTVPNFTPLGCFDDSQRVLPQRYISQAMMSHEYCFLTCTQAGFTYAGVEYGYECWCGNSLPEVTHELLADSCSQTCPGDSSETCGGVGAIELFHAVSA